MVAISIVERIVHWIEPAFVVAGYAIIAGGVAMERSIFIGLIVPGDLILALGGVYASQQKMSLLLVIVIGTLAAIAGESIGFLLGRKYGRRVVRRVPFVGGWLAEKLEQSEGFFKKHGGLTVAIGRYATAAGAFIPFTAGASKMSYRTFILFDAPAIAVWAAGISIFGYVFGQHLGFIDRALSRFGYVVLGLAVVLFLGRWLFRRWRDRRETA
ncbi:MAG TPA: DedA family protein [Actinomycetota bacterium]|nr:DedA family protein [Actinomycetota bacterium]